MIQKKIWLNTWTEEYKEGFPVGNGRLAAMMLGKPEKLRIALNHEWLWRGDHRFRDYPDVSQFLPGVRELLIKGDYLRGTEQANRFFGGVGGISGIPNQVDPYQPAGDVFVELDAGEVTDYRRTLDMKTGVAATEFTTPKGKILQQVFASFADGCIVLKVKSENPTSMNITLSRVEDPLCTLSYEPGNPLCMKGQFEKGIAFAVAAKVITDGESTLQGNTFCLKNAKKAIVLVQIGTSAKETAPEDELIFPDETCFCKLLERHLPRFTEALGEAELDVDVPDTDASMDERVKDFRDGGDPAIPILYFEYGRYLMVSGSSGELPINLQGKWNEDLLPPWSSDYHLNINLQMCYWFTETLGLKKQTDTLVYLMERYVPHGREMARKLYGCRGIFLTHQTDVWGRMTPESYGCAVWVGGGAWMARHLYLRWRYSRDEAFLKEHCYPFLKEAALFFVDYLMEHNGQYWVVPSQSPENHIEGAGVFPVSNCCNSAMDIELVTEVFEHTIECANYLHIDEDLVEQMRERLSRLAPLTVDSRGRLNEWGTELEETEPGHRHFSHLYGLYPSDLFREGSWQWKAAETSLDYRLACGGGHTGWSRSWTACMMARLGRPDDAWEHFQALISDFATASLLDLHPPRIFQIDGNMGGTACVCEMLMHAAHGEIKLLPALPKQWKNGSVKHFKAPDGVDVSFAWENGKLLRAEFASAFDQTVTVTVDGKQQTVELHKGQTTCI